MGDKIIFLGAKDVGYVCLRFLLEEYLTNLKLVYTAAEALKDKMSGFRSYDSLMESRSIPHRRVVDINHPDCEKEIAALSPDLMVQVGWSQIISDRILSIPQRGCVGFHSSLLPRDRGGSPVNWALIRGEKEWGTTLFYLEPGLDNGAMIGQKRFALTLEDTCKTVYDKCGEAMVELLKEHLPTVLTGTAPRIRQDESLATHNKRRKPGDGIVDWNRTSLELYNWVRALTHPYPGAFSFLGGKKMFVWKAKLLDDDSANNSKRETQPGQILAAIHGQGIVVKTKDGALLLERIQGAGSDEVDAAAYPDIHSYEHFSNSGAS